METDGAGFRYAYRRTARTGRFGPHARLVDARRVGEPDELQIYNYSPYDQRDLLAIHESSATFQLSLYPFHAASATLVSSCCFAESYYAPPGTLELLDRGARPTSEDVNGAPGRELVLHRDWEVELLELETHEGGYVCAQCYSPMPAASGAAVSLTRHATWQQEATRRAICDWLEQHGAGLLDSELAASLAWELWEVKLAQLRLHLAPTPERTFAYAHQIMAAYENAADEVEPLSPAITPEQLFEDCVCCRGNLKVHLTRKITVL